MDWPYAHLLLNHFPIILTVAGTIAAIFALVRRGRAIWLYALATLTFAGVTIYPVFLTGDEASETMRDVWYVSRDAIHTHEEAGELTLWVVLVMGAIAAFAWWRLAARERSGGPPRWLQVLVVLTALGALGAVTYTSVLGGRIVHEAERLVVPPAGALPRPPAGAPNR